MVIKQSNRLLREAVDSSALKILKTQMDTFPRNLLYLTMLWGGVVISRGLCQPQPFCDSIHNLRERRQCKKKQVMEGNILLSEEFMLSSTRNDAVTHNPSRQNSPNKQSYVTKQNKKHFHTCKIMHLALLGLRPAEKSSAFEAVCYNIIALFYNQCEPQSHGFTITWPILGLDHNQKSGPATPGIFLVLTHMAGNTLVFKQVGCLLWFTTQLHNW